jgi:hypothetical protein
MTASQDGAHHGHSAVVEVEGDSEAGCRSGAPWAHNKMLAHGAILA